MSERDSAHHDAAIQYLAWAVEEIEKSGNEEAARHARAALKVLQEGAIAQHTAFANGSSAVPVDAENTTSRSRSCERTRGNAD